MKTVEVMGAPGVGKSTLCNATWPPSVDWDGQPPPVLWRGFLEVAAKGAELIRPGAGAEDWGRMFEKAARKMGTLARRTGGEIYAGVGLAQRGLDLAWRLPAGKTVAPYFLAMPVDAGVVVLRADVDTIIARNRERGLARPSRELSRLAPLLAEPLELAVGILKDRGVRLLELDTRDTVSANVARLHLFTRSLLALERAAARHRGQVAPVPPSGDGA